MSNYFSFNIKLSEQMINGCNLILRLTGCIVATEINKTIWYNHYSAIMKVTAI